MSPVTHTFGAVHAPLGAQAPAEAWPLWGWLRRLTRFWPLARLRRRRLSSAFSTCALRASHGPAPARALGFAPPCYASAAYRAFDTDAAILYAVEQLTQVGLIEASGDTLEDNAALALWCRDPQRQVARYLDRHFLAEPGDALRWSTETLVYTTQGWV